MTPITDRLRRALTFAGNEMPTEAAQAALLDSFNVMRFADESEKNIIIMLACSVTGGLRHGNWPRERETA